MYCTECGTLIPENATNCPNCGAPVKQATPAPAPRPVAQPTPTPTPAPANTPMNAEPDVPSAGFNVLSFFIPLAGLIMFLIWKDATPIKAKACGKWALIGFIVWTVLNIILVACGTAASFFIDEYM